jgi:hypothetical protein
VRSAKLASEPSPTLDTEDIFHMTNLSPRMTGLPMSVWVSPRGNVRHDVRIKVNMAHGNQMSIDNTAIVAVRPSPRVVAGRLDTDDQRAVAGWIGLNLDAIVAYWDSEIDTGEFIERLRKLPTP